MDKIICIAGWAHRAEVMLPFSEALSREASVVLTSVYELCEEIPEVKADFTERRSGSTCSTLAKRLLELVQQQNSPATIIAWSMGAMLALEAAACIPEYLSKLILIGGTASFIHREDMDPRESFGISASNLRLMRRGLRQTREATLCRFFAACYGEQAQPGEIEKRSKEALGFKNNVLELGLDYLEQTDLRVILDSIKSDVLLIHGLNDIVIPAAAGKYLHRHIEGSSLMLLEGASHALCEKRPEVAQLVRGFLVK